MTVRGIVRQNRVELEPGATIPDGTPVRIETLDDEWVAQWESLAERVSQASRGVKSAVDNLTESRR